MEPDDRDPAGALIALLLVFFALVTIAVGFALLDRMIG